MIKAGLDILFITTTLGFFSDVCATSSPEPPFGGIDMYNDFLSAGAEFIVSE